MTTALEQAERALDAALRDCMRTGLNIGRNLIVAEAHSDLAECISTVGINDLLARVAMRMAERHAEVMRLTGKSFEAAMDALIKEGAHLPWFEHMAAHLLPPHAREEMPHENA